MKAAPCRCQIEQRTAEKTVVMLLSTAEIVLFQRFLIDARQTVQRQKETINACSCIGSTQYCFSSGNMILIHDMQVYIYHCLLIMTTVDIGNDDFIIKDV